MDSTMNYDSGNVYYNIIETNKTSFKQAKFSATRVQPILERPQDYELGVLRFNLPSYEIPIMFWKPPYKVSLEYAGIVYTEELVFIPNEPVGTPLYGKDTIWSYQEFLNSMNNAFALVLDAINTAILPAPPLATSAPRFVFNQTTGLFSYYVDPAFYEVDFSVSPPSTPLIQLYLNSNIFKLMPTFQELEIAGASDYAHKLLPSDTFTNTVVINAVTYLEMKQEATTLYLWSDLFAVEFETSSIPINPELLPSQNNQTRTIITDFEPLTGAPTREALQFFPQGPIRYYDLNSNYPMNRIDITVWWVDRENVRYPLYTSRGDIFSIKIQFRRKLLNLINNSVRDDDIV